jgi:hypothetical protein
MTPQPPLIPKMLALVLGLATCVSGVFGAQTVFSEDFSDPVYRTDFPFVVGSGFSHYSPGQWAAYQKDGFGSHFKDGKVIVNSSETGQWGVALVLDLSGYGPGLYKVSFDVIGPPTGIFSIAQIRGLGSVRILTNTLSSEVFDPGESRATVTNLLDPRGAGWVSLHDTVSRGTASFTFEFDGEGLIGFALSAFNQSVTIDDFAVTAKKLFSTHTSTSPK